MTKLSCPTFENIGVVALRLHTLYDIALGVPLLKFVDISPAPNPSASYDRSCAAGDQWFDLLRLNGICEALKFSLNQNKMSEVDPNDPLEGFIEQEDIHDFTASFDDPLISSYETTDITTSQDDENEGIYS